MSTGPAGQRVGLTGDFLTSEGTCNLDPQAWATLQAIPGTQVELIATPAAAALRRADVCRFDALLTKRNPVDAALLAPDAGGTQRLRLIVRNGVGLDHIDLPACSAAGVLVCTTPQAVARPVASAILALMLALSHRLLERDRQAREVRWAERRDHTGLALSGRTLGVIGLGNIGCELLRLVAPWGMRLLGHTRRFDPVRHAALGVAPADLPTLLAESDFVALCCPLTPRTRRLIDATALARMKPTAYLVNAARGEIVDEAALAQALRERRIAGAGLDVFETEPPARDNPLLALDNVVLGLHNLALTDEMNRSAGRAAVQAIAALALGRVPPDAVNPDALEHPNWHSHAR